MHSSFRSLVLAATLVAIAGCGKSDVANAQAAAGADGKPSEMVKLSEFGRSTWCAIAAGADGTIHAVFTDAKEAGKMHYLYYRASTDNGATWSASKNLSDDESDNSAGPCRVLVDGSGRVYAIWKYINENEILEGPNGYTNGILAVRVLEGGTWSKMRTFGDGREPMVSWFAAIGPDKKVNVVYTHADEAKDWSKSGYVYKNANNVDQLTFDGAGAPKVTRLQVAEHVLTKDEQDAAAKAGHYPTYEQTVPKNDGPWNLNGYIADDGSPRFLAEKYPASGEQPTILRFDGKQFAKYYEYVGYVGNTFNSPPVLVREADGKEHVIRKPEKSENDVVRDYVVNAGAPGDKTDVVTYDFEKAKISAWNANAIDGGRVVAMAAIKANRDVFDPTDLYVAIGDGKGGWTKAVNVTDNEQRAKFFAKAGMSHSTDYFPKFGQATSLKDGGVGVIVLNAEHSISGLNTAAVTAGGTLITGMSTSSAEYPYVSFVKVKG